MGRIAFVFSGQGDQYSGMGAELCKGYSVAATAFGLFDAIRPGTSEQCFSGTEKELQETQNTQPCLFAMETAAAAALTACGLKADMAAGFSLGELAALTFAGAVSQEDGFRLVCRRSQLMQRDATKQSTAMAAVLRLSNEQVEELCARYEGVYPVNYNCPGQVSVSGREEIMPEFLAAVKQAGGRAMPIKVKGGFHSPFMEEAGKDFSLELERVSFCELQIPVYSDVTANRYSEAVAPLLARQMCSPVRWESVVRNMVADGATVFVEIGPGKTLCRLIGRIDATVRTFAVCDYEHLEQLCREVSAC